MNTEFDQEKVAKACMRIAFSAMDYSDIHPDDLGDVLEHLKKAMLLMAGKLTERNQKKYAKWLLEKTNERIQRKSEEDMIIIKGYDTPEGYMGWIGDKYILFASYRDYRDYLEED